MAACSILIVIQEEGGGGRVERQKWETGNRRRYEGSVVFSILVSTVYVCVCVAYKKETFVGISCILLGVLWLVGWFIWGLVWRAYLSFATFGTRICSYIIM